MTARSAHGPDRADAVLASARAVLPGAQRCFALLVASLAAQLRDERRGRDVGAILEAIAEGKLYRLGGHRTFESFVRTALGISNPTAHRLRALARAPEPPPTRARGKTGAVGRRGSPRKATRRT